MRSNDPNHLSDEELAALDPETRQRLLDARHLRENFDSAVLGAALYGRLCDEGHEEEAQLLLAVLAPVTAAATGPRD